MQSRNSEYGLRHDDDRALTTYLLFFLNEDCGTWANKRCCQRVASKSTADSSQNWKKNAVNNADCQRDCQIVSSFCSWSDVFSKIGFHQQHCNVTVFFYFFYFFVVLCLYFDRRVSGQKAKGTRLGKVRELGFELGHLKPNGTHKTIGTNVTFWDYNTVLCSRILI